MKSALVTGGAGFIGSHVAAALLERGVVVTVLDNFETGQRAHVPASARLIEADLTDATAVEEAMAGAEVVFHLAAFVAMEDSFQRPHRCVEVNTVGVFNVLRSAARHGVRKVVFSSSSAVYADEPAGSKDEREPPRPANLYGVTKVSGEHLLEMYAQLDGLPYVALRYFNVFGPRQSPDSDYAAVIPAFISRALRGDHLIIYGDGTQTRDFVYVDDVVHANLLAAQAGQGVYNIGTGVSRSVLELAREVLSLSRSPSDMTYAPPRQGDVHDSRAAVTKAARELRWAPRWSLADGLVRTIAWFRQQQDEVDDHAVAHRT
ncbi:MAG: SDR family NAD(P)-dependent oxidoreductase [Candidatus Omnitrophica bacterium]|nr:SDR family NAD(P)-dependent oxidoreductase [Candidatus Omnitrophota bacterium]